MLFELSELVSESSEQKYFLVATSGGPDSMAMLDMISKLTKHLVVVHVNYKTRPESDSEQQLVARFAFEQGLVFEYDVADDFVKGNFQHWARQKRYSFFLKMYKKYNAKGLFIGHHLDDSIETYLWQSARNSVFNYAGIPDKTILWGMNVYRPLLDFDKDKLIQYCIGNHIPFSMDSSNATTKYTRNKIRHEIVANYSLMEKYEVVKTMTWVNSKLKEQQDHINEFMKEHTKGQSMELDAFFRLEDEFQIRILYQFLHTHVLEPNKLSKHRLSDIRLQLMGDKPNVQIRLDDSIVLSKEYHQATIYTTQYPQTYTYQMIDEKVDKVGPFLITKSGPANCGVAVTEDDYPLTLRNPLPEDKIVLKNGTKRLNRLFIDEKVPMRFRQTTPVLVNRVGEIILVVGLAKDFKRIHMQNTLYVIK